MTHYDPYADDVYARAELDPLRAAHEATANAGNFVGDTALELVGFRPTGSVAVGNSILLDYASVDVAAGAGISRDPSVTVLPAPHDFKRGDWALAA